MKLIFCIDDKSGMMFFGKRQSQDQNRRKPSRKRQPLQRMKQNIPRKVSLPNRKSLPTLTHILLISTKSAETALHRVKATDLHLMKASHLIIQVGPVLKQQVQIRREHA